MMNPRSEFVNADLELDSPAFTCGDCRFMTCLTGVWSVVEGRLVFTADADPQPRRGPDLHGCCESWNQVRFTRIVTDTGQVFPIEDLR